MKFAVTPEYRHSSEFRQFKLIHALVQELSVKIDYELINAVMKLMDSGEEEADLQTAKPDQRLEEDKRLAEQPLKDIATLTVSKGQKHFYDTVHLSPIHLHLSFSATGLSSALAENAGHNFFVLLIKSLGIGETSVGKD